VVDDGSVDGTESAIATEFPGVTVLRGDGTLWWAGATNLGVRWVLERAASCDYILTLNDDTEFGPEYVSRLVDTALEYPKSLIGSLVVDALNHDVVIDGGVSIHWPTAKQRDLAEGLTASEVRSSARSIRKVDALSGRGVLIPVDVFREVGVYNVRWLPQYAADYELSIRAARVGYVLYMDQGAVVATALASPKHGNGRTGLSNIAHRLFSRRSPLNPRYRIAYGILACPWYWLPLYLVADCLRVLLRSVRSRLVAPPLDRKEPKKQEGIPPVGLIAYEGLVGNDVVKAQVLGLATELSLRGVAVQVFLFERLDRYALALAEIRKNRRHRGANSIQVVLLPRLPGALGVKVGAFTLWPFVRGFRGVLHCRGMKGVLVAASCPRATRQYAVLGDFRGAEPEESAYLSMRAAAPQQAASIDPLSPAPTISQDALEHRAVDLLDRAVCVSAALSSHLLCKYPSLKSRVSVVHCGATHDFVFSSDDRDRIRASLCIEDSLVLCYLGRLSAVHRPDLLTSLVGHMARSSNSPVVLVVITSDSAEFAELRSRLDPSVRVERVAAERSEIPGYLSACDAGLLTLDGAYRNKVSFPVKFSEYACCGLPVIATDSAQDPASYIRASGIGALVSVDSDAQWSVDWPEGLDLGAVANGLRRVTPCMRAAFSESAAQHMRFDLTTSQLIDEYRVVWGSRR
jgi:GT2 family glycosyltransferase/glycosyltransferase involved in cell wall biosynthesis